MRLLLAPNGSCNLLHYADISVILKYRIIYLSLSEINAKKLMQDIDKKVEAGDVEGAKELCRNTRGPVASICYQGLMHIDEHLDDIERSVSGYGTKAEVLNRLPAHTDKHLVRTTIATVSI